ncbi:MAG: EF-hand domain-containing protein [Planctomycetota bacterium]
MNKFWRRVLVLFLAMGIVLEINSWAFAAKEMSAARQAKLLEKFPDADADRNGILTNQEYRDFLSKRSKAKRSGGSKSGLLDGLLQAHPELDTDGNGVLSKDERNAGRTTIGAYFQAKMAEKILAEHPEADLNGDGQLSPEESRAFRRKQASKQQQQIQVSLPQTIGWLVKNFTKVDLDGNGELSKEELQSLKKKMDQSNRDKKGAGKDSRKKKTDKVKGGKAKGDSKGKQKDKKKKDQGGGTALQ